MRIKKVLLLSDLHLPAQDTRALKLTLAVADWIRPDEIDLLGDISDFYGINGFGKDPGVKDMLLDEVDDIRSFLASVNSRYKYAKKVYIEGNHENRLERYIQKNASALYGLINVPELLKLKEMAYNFVPYGPDQKYRVGDSNLIARHENITGGVHAAHATVTKAMCSVAFGHTHRVQEARIVTLGGEEYLGINTGCLCDKNHPYMQYVKNHHQWTLAFTIVYILPNGKWFHNTIHINNYTCLVEGKVFKA